MPRITRQEQKRLLGPLYRAEKKTTARNLHRLRKSLECFTEAELEECFPEGLVNLQVVMRPTGLHKIGTIRQTFIVDNKAVVTYGHPLPRGVLVEYIKWCEAYDELFMSRGKAYTVRNEDARPALQVAEQAWHNYIVGCHERNGRPPRPAWALETIPGMQRVNTANDDQLRFDAGFPPVAAPAPIPAPIPAPAQPRLAPFPALQRLAALPSPPRNARPSTIDLTVPNPAPRGLKRKASSEIVYDDKNKAVVRPRKKKHLGFVDLTK